MAAPPRWTYAWAMVTSCCWASAHNGAVSRLERSASCSTPLCMHANEYTEDMLLRIICVVALSTAVLAQQSSAPQTPLVERVGDTGFIQLQANSFSSLDTRQQALGYWLTQAAIAIDPIVYDQLSQYGVRQKRLLEEIMGHPQGIPAAPLGKIRQYALLFWANRGNHNENTSQKFLPTFTADELKGAALQAQRNGGFKASYADLPPLT